MTGIYAYTNETPLNRSHGQALGRYTISFVGVALAAIITIIAAKATPTLSTNPSKSTQPALAERDTLWR